MKEARLKHIYKVNIRLKSSNKKQILETENKTKRNKSVFRSL